MSHEQVTMYICDPAKNKECSKENCAFQESGDEQHECFCTADRECALLGKNGMPVEYFGQKEDVLKLAAKEGAKAGLERYKTEQKRQRRIRISTQLHNTKKLMRHFREIELNAANAIASIRDAQTEDFDFYKAVMEDDARVDIQAILQAKARSALIIEHIKTMLAVYGQIAGQSGDPTEIRRYRVLMDMYVKEPRKSVQDIAEREAIDQRTVYRDYDAACERLSALLYGVQGVIDDLGLQASQGDDEE